MEKAHRTQSEDHQKSMRQELGRFLLLSAVVISALSCIVLSVLAAKWFTAAEDGFHSLSSSSCASLGSRLIALADVHGDTDKAVSALLLATAIDSSGSWIAANATLVQTGDLVDRGGASVNTTIFFETIKVQAQGVGGAVHLLLGNHEVMQLQGDLRYVSKAELAALGRQQSGADHCQTCEYKKCLGGVRCEEQVSAGRDVLLSMLRDVSSPYGAALRGKKAAVVAGEGACRTLFVHAGLSDAVLLYLMDSKGGEEADGSGERDIIHTLNTLLSGVLSGSTVVVSGDGDGAAEVLLGGLGPLWYRGYAQHSTAQLCPRIRSVLRSVGAERVVVGHTVQHNNRATSRCGGRLHLIDVGMCVYYHNTSAVWQCRCGQAWMTFEGGRTQGMPLSDAPL